MLTTTTDRLASWVVLLRSVAVVGVLLTAIVGYLVATGIGNPPRAGRPQERYELFGSNMGAIAPLISLGDRIVLPHATIEIGPDAANRDLRRPWRIPAVPLTIRLRVDTKPVGTASSRAGWALRIEDQSLAHPIQFWIYTDGFYRFDPYWPQTTWTAAIHTKRGASNELTLDARTDGIVTIRINQEIVWDGPLHIPAGARILLVIEGDPQVATTVRFVINLFG